MSLHQMIRRFAGGHPPQAVAEANADDPEKKGVDPTEEDAAEGEQPEDKTEDPADEPDGEEPAAEGDEPADDPDGDEMSAADRTAFARGFAAAQARTGAILGHDAAERAPELAAKLAFSQEFAGLSANAAIALMESSPAPAGKLGKKMAATQQPKLGGSPASSPADTEPGARIFAAATAMIAAKRGS